MNLQWIVRQMSWCPPWVETDPLPRDTLQARRGYAGCAKSVCGDGGETMGVAEPGGALESREESSVSGASVAGDVESGCEDREPCPVDALPSAPGSLESEEEEGAAVSVVADVAGGEVNPQKLWSSSASRQLPDEYGYGRIPGFWFTLNLPYNYLYDIHRFHRAVREAATEGAGTDGAVDPLVDALCAESREAVDVLVLWQRARVVALVSWHQCGHTRTWM